jgi:hypothetical protein
MERSLPVLPTERPTAWSDPAWRPKVEAWMQAVLKDLGLPPAGPPEEVKKASISCVLRAPTPAGWVYFKAASPLPFFADEGRVTKSLSGLFPDHVPRPLAIHPEEAWLLLPDLGKPVGWEAPLATKAQAMAVFARLHHRSQGMAETLLGAGCLDRRLPVLKGQVDSLLDCLGFFPRLKPEDVQAMRALAPRLKRRCDEVAALPLPMTLVHGDLHLGNAAQSGDGLAIFDWTDACVSHPFFDLHTLEMEQDPAVSLAQRDAYLEAWQGSLSKEALLRAYALVQPLIALHQAVSYQHIIVGGFEGAAKEFNWAMPRWVGMILRTMKETDA